MMTAMTSLASLAHAVAAPAFNGLFYATTATIIPVLFLALTLQGTIFDRALRAYHSATKAAFTSAPGWQSTATLFAASVLRMTLTLILLAGVGGEALAIYALSQQQASASTQHHVLSSAIILTFATAAGPIISNATAYAAAHRAPAPAIPGPPPVPASRHA
jgi:hypothetical protein